MDMIHSIHIVVAAQPDGGEGIVAILDEGTNRMMPLICSNNAALDAIRTAAHAIAKQNKQTLRLLRFDCRVDVESFGP